MQIYPVGESVCGRMLDLPVASEEWVVVGADAASMIAAGFMPLPGDATRFRHEQSGDVYQLARHQRYDASAGKLRFQCNPGVTLESELATRALTLLAMASDAGDIIDPFGGQEDMIDGLLRHVTPLFVHEPKNLLTVAVWSARLSRWGFSVAHDTHGLMQSMVKGGVAKALTGADIADAVLRALDAPRPSAFFRLLHRCGALRVISAELDALYEPDAGHAAPSKPDIMKALDAACEKSRNVSHVVKVFHNRLGDSAEAVFLSLGLEALYRPRGGN